MTFVGVNVNDPVDEGLALARRYGLGFDLVRDPGQEVVRAVGGTRLPLTLFVDADGRVEAHQARELDAEELDERIDELLA